MSVALDNALPLMNTDGITSGDTDRVMRKFIASMLMPDIKSANPLAVRAGVMPHNWDSGGCTSLRVQQQTTATMNVDILAGPAIIERSGQGPYLIYSESTVSVTIPTSDVTNPRIDVVYAWVGDQSLSGSTDLVHGPVVDVLKGVAQVTPMARTDVPDGAQVLAYVRVEANVTTIVAAKITDMRMSTCVTGGVRRMLPGDKVSDVGRVDGELRYRKAASPYPSYVDYWDADQAVWRGTQDYLTTSTLPGTPDGNNLVHGSLSGGTTISSFTIIDPGFPYRIVANATLQITGSGSANFYLAAGGGFISCIANVQGAGSLANLQPNSNTKFSGATVVSLHGDVISGSAGWQADYRNKINCLIIPA